MNFQRINQFSTNDPVKLGRELSRVEDNIAGALEDLQEETTPLPDVVDFTSTDSTPIVALRPDAQVNFDTSIRSGAAVLPPLKPSNFGRRFVLIKTVAANAIAVSCQDTSVTLNGSTYPTLTACGVSVFYCSKLGYYS